MYKHFKEEIEQDSSSQETEENKSHVETNEDAKVEEDETEEEWPIKESIKLEWEKEQAELKSQLILKDVDNWAKLRLTEECLGNFRHLNLIGGVDISFVKGDLHNACAALVVLSYPDLKVVHQDLSMVHLSAPYIPGFLAFREAEFLVEKVKNLRLNQPELMPQVIVVDGNGVLHPRGFGLACHLGVVLDIPTIGAAKNLYHVDGLERDEKHFEQVALLKEPGDSFPLIGQSGNQLGVEAKNPIFVSPGHKISMETAAWVAEITSRYRVPEPTRQADQLSREYLRQNWKTTS